MQSHILSTDSRLSKNEKKKKKKYQKWHISNGSLEWLRSFSLFSSISFFLCGIRFSHHSKYLLHDYAIRTTYTKLSVSNVFRKSIGKSGRNEDEKRKKLFLFDRRIKKKTTKWQHLMDVIDKQNEMNHTNHKYIYEFLDALIGLGIPSIENDKKK